MAGSSWILIYQGGGGWFVKLNGVLAGGFKVKEHAELFVSALKDSLDNT
jgi:hypothetical protein